MKYFTFLFLLLAFLPAPASQAQVPNNPQLTQCLQDCFDAWITNSNTCEDNFCWFGGVFCEQPEYGQCMSYAKGIFKACCSGCIETYSN
ncbi:MAG: hypothetical protein HN844_03950 [Planctomycetes bacterium]|jgi:hypothetical protein|nr:hypothetical protein [Planctomycetota bacterium]MBT7318352.1 hypothetical protein [Planctomycetota bacterium]